MSSSESEAPPAPAPATTSVTSTPSSSVKRILLTGPPSILSRLFWYAAKYILPLWVGLLPEPVKGQQVWKLPPPRIAKSIAKGEIVLGEWVEPKSGWKISTIAMPRDASAPPPKRALMYFHGGGFMSPIAGVHWSWTAWLADQLDAIVYVVPYPLAPINTVHEWLPTLVDVWESFLEKSTGQETVVAGDSAGAVLSLCLANAAHAASLPLPKHIIAVSPAANLDLFALDAEMRLIEPNDPLLHISTARRSRRLWLGLPLDSPDIPLPSSFLSNPSLNPAAGDLSIFKEAGTQLILSSGSYDILHPYVEAYVDEAERKGVRTVYIGAEGMFHCFPLAKGLLHESAVAADAIVEAVLSYKP